MGNILCIANNKGGVGKTSISIALADAFLWLQENEPSRLPEDMQTLPILIVDMDPQANTTEALGIDPTTNSKNIKDVLENPSIMSTPEGLNTIVPIAKKDNAFALPSSLSLEGTGLTLMTTMNGNTRLRFALDRIAQNYSLIIIDTPPSLGSLTQNGIIAAHYAIIPIILSKHALYGVTNMLSFLATAKESHNARLKTLGILINAYDKRYRLQNNLLNVTKRMYGDFVFETVLGTSSRLLENLAGRRKVFWNMTSEQRSNLINLTLEVFQRCSPAFEPVLNGE